MTDAWKQWDLSGAGLQTLNLELTRRLRRSQVAFGLWLAFPLGLHAFYLRERGRGGGYLAASASLVMLGLFTPPIVAAVGGGVYLMAALADLWTLSARLTAYNKDLRVRLTLRKDRGPPPGFRGRYTDQDTDIGDYIAIKDQERAGHNPRSPTPEPDKAVTSFQEQEARLRAHMARHKALKNPRS